MAAFVVDGREFNVIVPDKGIKRQGRVLDGEDAGRLQNGEMERDIIGTYYNYTIPLETSRLNREEYDELYEILSAPVDYHMLQVPYGQTVILFRAYVANLDDTLVSMRNGINKWTGLSINFVAMGPYRTP